MFSSSRRIVIRYFFELNAVGFARQLKCVQKLLERRAFLLCSNDEERPSGPLGFRAQGFQRRTTNHAQATQRARDHRGGSDGENDRQHRQRRDGDRRAKKVVAQAPTGQDAKERTGNTRDGAGKNILGRR